MSGSNGNGRTPETKRDPRLPPQAANVPMYDPGMRYEYAPPYSPQRTDPDYQKNWQRPPEYDPPPDDTLLGPFMMARAAQQFAAQGGAPEPTGIYQSGGARIPQTRMYDVSPWNQTVTPSTAAPQLSRFQQLRQMEQKANVPQDVERIAEGMIYGPQTLHGQMSLMPQQYHGLEKNGVRPLGPGEFINNPNPVTGEPGISSEMTVTVPYQGKWAVLPSLWLVNGRATVVDEDTAVQFAQQSGLIWPTFDSLSKAETFANQREKTWRNSGGRTDTQPPLWQRPFPMKR